MPGPTARSALEEPWRHSREHPSPSVRTTSSTWGSGSLQVPQHHCRRITRTGMRPESLEETIPKSTKADDRKPSSNLWAKIKSRQIPALLHRQQQVSAPGVRKTRSTQGSGRSQVPRYHCRGISRTGMRPGRLEETAYPKVQRLMKKPPCPPSR